VFVFRESISEKCLDKGLSKANTRFIDNHPSLLSLSHFSFSLVFAHHNSFKIASYSPIPSSPTLPQPNSSSSVPFSPISLTGEIDNSLSSSPASAPLPANRTTELTIFDPNVRYRHQPLSLREELERASGYLFQEASHSWLRPIPSSPLTRQSSSSLLSNLRESDTYPKHYLASVSLAISVDSRIAMVNSKHVEFGGDIGENVDHFLWGFSLAFANEEAKLVEGSVPE